MISGQAVRKFRHGQEREPRARQIAVGEKRERERETRAWVVADCCCSS
jgi:hypothetical protein